MKRVFLIRHAKSDWGQPGLADFDRPLNKRGKRDAPQMGKRLKTLGVAPDLIVSSPAKRAKTTARKIADELGYARDAIVLNEILYSAHPEDTLSIIRATDAVHDSVMIFGHNPTTTDAINLLSDYEVGDVPTCSVFCATFDVNDWKDIREGEGTFVFFEYPKLLS